MRAKFQVIFHSLVLASALTLAACGGGGDDSAPATSVPAAGFARFSGTVRDGNGAPVADADVRLPFPGAAGWGGRTDANGNYRFDARASDYQGISPVVMLITKDGYRPRAVQYASVASGSGHSFVSTSANASTRLGANEVVPKNSTGLWHIGNGVFGGAVNSQFQTNVYADGVFFEAGIWTTDRRAQFSRVHIDFSARGVDDSSCRNAFGMGGGQFYAYQFLNGSDPSGGLTRYRLTLDLSTAPVGEMLYFIARSGDCPGTSDPLDDLEFTELLLTFVP